MDCVLAGDIGGTKTALALFARQTGGGYRKLAVARYSSAEYAGLGPIVQQFLGASCDGAGAPRPRSAAFGVAGPVDAGVCQTTNLPWVISSALLSAQLGVPVGLVNDFHAVALGVGELLPEDLVVLQPGEVDPRAPVAILGAGTGLGEAVLLPSPAGQLVLPSEGGHCDFAPRTALEIKLLQFLLHRHHRVSVERVVSGTGLRTLYEFVLAEQLAPESPDVRAELLGADAGSVIGKHGAAGTDPACVRALDMMVALYGAEAGNLALKVLPLGGLYVAGGVAPKIIDKLRAGSFMQAFLDKGRMSSVLQRIRVSVVMDAEVGLLGARVHASALAVQ